MAFSASFSSITETSARFRASFTGGDSGFSYYRYVRLDIDRDTYEIRSDSVGGASSSFSETIRGLDPGTTYDWEAQLGYEDASGSITWLSIYDSGSFTTDSAAPAIDLWSWSSSNGEASSSQTRAARNAMDNEEPAENFPHEVWNDIVNKVQESLDASGLSWERSSSQGATLSRSGCLMSSGDTLLTAAMYNSVKYQIGQGNGSDGIYVDSEDEFTWSHIESLTDYLNLWIESI